MLLSFRFKGEERRPEWRGGGVISWQKLVSALSPLGANYVPLSSPSLAKAAKDTEGEESQEGKTEEKEKEEVFTLGTHSSPLFAFWQASYVTQLITHLITASA